MKQGQIEDAFRLYAQEFLVDASAIAERLEVQRKTVHVWRDRYDDFPEPVAVLAVGPVWYWPDVESWRQRRAS